jgi:lauroyl/myristoyl acyltransferase
MRRLLGDFHVTGVFWFRLHLFGVSILPKPGVTVIVTLFTTFFFVVLFNIRRAIAANLSVVLGPCGWWQRQARIYRTMWEFAWCLSERYEAVGTDRRVACDVEGKEIWDRLVSSERGFVMVTAHIGNWEIGSSLPAKQASRRVHLVREMELDPKAQEFIAGIIRKHSDEDLVVHFAGQHDPALGLELLSALRRGEIVALQGDRPRASERPVPATLFGRPVRLPAGPVALARAAGVPILPVFVFREGRLRSRLVLRETIDVPDTGHARADIQEGIRLIAEHLEWAIRQRPQQWFCFRELWPE